MTDMGPRRMDGTRPATPPARPVGGGTAKPLPVRPAASNGVSATRPSQPVRRPMQQTQATRASLPAQPVRDPARSQPVAAPLETVPRSRGGFGVVIQFVIGLLVIVGVAAAVVWLWVKYYQ